MMKGKIYFVLLLISIFFISNTGIVNSYNLTTIKHTLDLNDNISSTTEYEDYRVNDWLSNQDEIPLYVPGELIVKFRGEIDLHETKEKEKNIVTGEKSLDILSQEFSVLSYKKIFNSISESTFSNIYKITMDKGTNITSATEKYSNIDIVEFAEPNYIFKIYNIPNDEYFNKQWGLNQSSDYDIDAPEAWDIDDGDSDVTIAILDTGVDYNHEDLADNIWVNKDEIPNNHRDDDNNGYVDDIHGWDFVDTNDNVTPGEDGTIIDNDPMDFHGHGTHCSGIASAVTNNDIGIAGVGWNCKIMPVRIGYVSENGSGLVDSDGASLGAIYAADNGADVISMSYGGILPSILMHSSLKYAYEKGVVLVAAAGNENTYRKRYPAGYDEVISVAATDRNDYRAFFSNYGSWVDVAAPGLSINSTIPNDSYEAYSGTSMACPHVAGLAGLVLSKNKDLSPKRVRTIIEYSVDRLDPDNLPLRRGRINAYKALSRGTGDVTSILDHPAHGSEIRDTIDIKGTAYGDNFEKYVIEYTRSTERFSSVWIELYQSYSPVQNGLLYSLDTTNLSEGLYTIRLRVIADNETYDDAIWVIVNNKINTFYVDDDDGPGIDHTSIRYAIYDAANGDNIYVYNGTYKESLNIYKSIILTGENKETTVINGTGQSDNIYVHADYVEISGFTIKNSGIFRGIFFYKAENNALYDNIITKNWIGIKLSYSINNLIENNVIIDNVWTGILLTRWSRWNKITHNNFICSLPLLYIHAFFRNSYFNQWNDNYWDDWVGLQIKILRFKPKRIPGRILDFIPDLNPPIFEDIFHSKLTLRANYDWNSSAEPHDL